MNILIIGGSRFVGPILVDLLVKHGNKVTVFNRGTRTVKYPEGVRFICGDRNKEFGITEKFEAVIDMCAYNGIHTTKAIRELYFDFFVHFGTVASYKKPNIFPVYEDWPWGDWDIMGDYGKGKAECEQVLAGSGIKYASLRPNYIFGPKNYCDRENFIYSRIMSGVPLVLPGNGQGVVQFVFVDEVARSLAFLAEHKAVGGFNCVGDDMVTITSLVEQMGLICGREPIIGYNPETDGVNFNEAEFPFDNNVALFDNRKIKALGIGFRPLVDGLRQNWDGYYKNNLESVGT